MSGSSLDGLDMALCSFEESSEADLNWEIIHTEAIDFPVELKQGLSRCSRMSVRELKELEVRFSIFCSKTINSLNLDVPIDFIASHGHTVIHHPKDGYSLQIGSGAIIAELTGISTICDFRANDIALGGQGAPVAPIVEQLLFKGYDFYINLGGIANVSVHQEDKIKSWDSVPCNQVLNHYAKLVGEDYDDKGQLARKGRLHEGLLTAWLDLPYFHQAHPKSLDNDWVQNEFISVAKQFNIETNDILKTMVEVCAKQLALDMTPYTTEEEDTRKCLITGGGAHNDFLVERLSDILSGFHVDVVKPNVELINYKEAVLMALMGYLRANHKENTISSVTGARSNTIGGCVYRSGM